MSWLSYIQQAHTLTLVVSWRASWKHYPNPVVALNSLNWTVSSSCGDHWLSFTSLIWWYDAHPSCNQLLKPGWCFQWMMVSASSQGVGGWWLLVDKHNFRMGYEHQPLKLVLNRFFETAGGNITDDVLVWCALLQIAAARQGVGVQISVRSEAVGVSE